MRPAAALKAAALVGAMLVAAGAHALQTAQGDARPERTTERTTERTPDRTGDRAPATPTTLRAQAKDSGVDAALTLTASRGWQPGSTVDGRIEVRVPTGARVQPLALGGALGAWDVLPVPADVALQPAPDGGAVLTFKLVAWDAGTVEVPAIPLRVTLADGTVVELAVGPLQPTLESLLQADAPLAELAAPVRGPVDIVASRWMWLIAAGVGLGITIAVALWLLRRSSSIAPPPPVLPPDEWALREMERLEGDRLPDRGEFAPFFARLSDIVRDYVERRWGISAPEQTTKEFLRSARQHPELSGGHEQTLGQFLRTADMVKFAAVRPPADECSRALDLMRGFVRASAPALSPAPSGQVPGEGSSSIEPAAPPHSSAAVPPVQSSQPPVETPRS